MVSTLKNKIISPMNIDIWIPKPPTRGVGRLWNFLFLSGKSIRNLYLFARVLKKPVNTIAAKKDTLIRLTAILSSIKIRFYQQEIYYACFF